MPKLFTSLTPLAPLSPAPRIPTLRQRALRLALAAVFLLVLGAAFYVLDLQANAISINGSQMCTPLMQTGTSTPVRPNYPDTLLPLPTPTIIRNLAPAPFMPGVSSQSNVNTLNVVGFSTLNTATTATTGMTDTQTSTHETAPSAGPSIVRVTAVTTWLKRVRYVTHGGRHSAAKDAHAYARYQRALDHAYTRYLKAYGKALAQPTYAKQQRALVRAWNQYQKAKARAAASYARGLGRDHTSETYRKATYGYRYGARANGQYVTITGSYTLTTLVSINN